MLRLFGLILFFVFTTGCTYRYALDVYTGSCLNPPAPPAACKNHIRDSRPIGLRVYPLSRCPDLSTLRWSDFLAEGGDRKALEQLLLEAPTEAELVRLQRLALERSYPPRTRCLLLVTIGRSEGEASLGLIQRYPFQHHGTVQLDRYDIRHLEF